LCVSAMLCVYLPCFVRICHVLCVSAMFYVYLLCFVCICHVLRVCAMFCIRHLRVTPGCENQHRNRTQGVPVFPAEGSFVLKWFGPYGHMLTVHCHNALSFVPETFTLNSGNQVITIFTVTKLFYISFLFACVT
jgi:hypothetical protein